ncbi:uncharacterized protein DUF4430 [Ruminiclostridium sufflavum DSM 19573]|uniref:Uncharacterized protein DUF4430 n=1 Tax=Ruminiclostridium sufflavum DSM 19573 TaxID=1121337 RepID=A0A318XN58_9FIRM|nr:DUF4430 domain-containing protein [Ruminiclostridium sufflavum]PYG87391.1 uncharacterized protein DUF4430 [Ruminiclostridium sufflavum DSM 19573]
MSKNIKKILCIFMLAVILSTMLSGIVLGADPITVTVRIQGYSAGANSGSILNEYQVTLNDSTGFTAYAALSKACSDKSISLVASGSGASTYVSSIDGQTEGYFTPNSSYYSGWMFRVWRQADPTTDELPSVSAGAYTMQGGDKMTWYYAIPAESWYTCMSNYSSIGTSYPEGSSIAVNVKAQKFTDIMNWTLTGFNNLSGATVVLAKASNGLELASATTDASGNAYIVAPDVAANTACYLYVKNKFFTSGALNTGLQHVKSWRKSVTITAN